MERDMKKIIFLLPIILFASVNIKVNKKHLNIGEKLIITISAEGKNIQFPNIKKIGNFDVLSTSISNNIIIINGSMKESVSKSYILIPDRNFTIPSFSIKVNGKIYKTDPIKITVSVPKQTKGNYTLEINLNKSKAYLGENLILSLKYQEKKSAASVNIQKPSITGAIIKLLNKKEIKNGVVYNFLVIPQKAGHFKIGPFIANVGEEVKETLFNDPFFTMKSIKYKTIFSNQLTLDVYPIPENSVYGNFKISINAKKTIKANKPNNAVLKIEGCGDFYDLPEFYLKIPNTTIYEKKPILKTFITNNKLCGIFSKEFTIISDSDYTIPQITLKEFNGSINILKTKPIKVKVIGAVKRQQNSNLQVKQNKDEKAFNYLPYLFVLIAGIFIGGLFVYLIKIKRDDFIYKIKKANEKELFNLLLPYESHPKIKEILNKLDENIYQNRNHKINKKEIIKIIKKLRE